MATTGRQEDALRSTQRLSGQSRRKKRTTSIDRHETKENEPPPPPSNRSYSSIASRRKRRGNTSTASSSSSAAAPTSFLDMDDDIILLESASQTDDGGDSKVKKQEAQNLVRELRQCLSKMTVSFPTINDSDNDDEGLIDRVARASLGISQPGTRSVLEEHTSSLLSFSRKLIKEVAAGAPGKKDNDKKMSEHLSVAVHVLRSISFAVVGPKTNMATDRVESLLKLFFHLIVTAADASLNEGSFAGGRIACLGYEGLGCALSFYSIKVAGRPEDDKHCIQSFEEARCPVGRNAEAIFAVPRFKVKTTTTKRDVGTMTVRQVATIAIKTTMAVSKILDRSIREPKGKATLQEVVFPASFSGDGALLHQLVSFLQRQVVAQWLVLLAKESTMDKDDIKEVVSYTKGSHRLLWDMASHLKTTQNSVASDVEAECLSLRKDAILMLLLDTSASEITKAIRRVSFESACTYAWKAAGVFSQQTSRMPGFDSSGHLVDFFGDIDPAVETIFSSDSSFPLFFVEYRAYKILHSPDDAPCRLTADGRGRISKNASDGNYKIVHDIVSLGAHCKRMIENGLADGTADDFVDTQTGKDDAALSVQSLFLDFGHQVTHQIDKLPFGVHGRIFKILCLLGLEKVLYKVVKQGADVRAFKTSLRVAAKLLAECIGGYAVALLKIQPAEEEKQNVDFLMECFVRPVACFDLLAFQSVEDIDCNTGTPTENLSLSNQYCAGLYGFCISGTVPTSCLEKAAKFFSLTARARIEKSLEQESLIPQLYSILVYAKLESFGGTGGPDYQLPSRILLLANNLQSSGKADMCFLALCAALLTETTNSSIDNAADFLNLLASKSGNTLFPATDPPALSSLLKSTCRRMATLLMESEIVELSKSQPTLSTSALTPVESILAMIHETVYEADALCGVQDHSLLTIERTVSWLPIEGQMAIASGFLEVLEMLGRSIQQCTSEDGTLPASAMNSFRCVFELLDRIVAAMDTLSCAYRGILSIVAATSIVPAAAYLPQTSTKWINPSNQNLIIEATDLLQASLLNFDSFDDRLGLFSSSDLVSEIIRISIRSLNASLLSISTGRDAVVALEDSDLVNDCCTLAEALVSFSDTSESSQLLEYSKQWTMWTLIRTQDRLEGTGEKVGAILLALWNLSLQSDDGIARRWFSASVVTASLEESVVECSSHAAICSDWFAEGEATPIGSVAWVFEREYELCRLRLCTLRPVTGDEGTFDSAMKRLETIRLEIESAALEVKEDDLVILHLWLTSTLYLVHSDVSASYGCYPAALRSTQHCLQSCKSIMKRTGPTKVNFDSWLSAVASSTALARAAHRYAQVLSRRPKLYYRMGDHRKALAYMQAVFDFLKIDARTTSSSDKESGTIFHDLILALQSAPSSSKRYTRQYLEIISWASTPDFTIEGLSPCTPQHLVHCNTSESTPIANDLFQESIRDLISVGDILYGDSVNESFRHSFSQYYQEAIALIAQGASSTQQQLDSLNFPSSTTVSFGVSLFNQVQLRHARHQIENMQVMDETMEVSVRTLCGEVEKSKLSSPDDKAWALYYLGSIQLDMARSSGALELLWNSEGTDGSLGKLATDQYIEKARHYLYRASLLAFDSSDILARSVSRSLALAIGPDSDKYKNEEGYSLSAGILVLSSIGQSLRRRMSSTFFNSRDDRLDERQRYDGLIPDIFSAFDSPGRLRKQGSTSVSSLLDDLASLTPSNWKFVAPALCPSGDVLVTSLEKDPTHERFTISTRCVFRQGDVHAYDKILKPFDAILVKLQDQLQGTLDTKDEKQDDVKRKWWDERGQLDGELCELLQCVESAYFPSLIPIDDDAGIDDMDEEDSQTSDVSDSSRHSDESEPFPKGNLASRFDAAIHCETVETSFSFSGGVNEDGADDDFASFTVAKIKDRLRTFGVSESGFKKMKKADLLGLLADLQNQLLIERTRQDQIPIDLPVEESADPCLFLILDENLHRFPFEGMPHLLGRTVCRVPCLSFVLAALNENQPDPHTETVHCVDPNMTSFVLDPENNLLSTRKRLLPVLQDLSSSRDWSWNKVVGEIPSPTFFSQALTASHGMMMYFGHGGAQSCFSRRRVEELIDGRVSSLKGRDAAASATNGHEDAAPSPCCKSVVVLMGCSSGRLVSVNRKNTNLVEQAPLYYEPEGVALSYLCAGAPCVIGNLWDVTDHDIDRFSVSLLDNFLGGADDDHADETQGSRSLAKSVSLSRSACKLRYLVGCAPVCYGIPVYLLRVRKRRKG